MANRNDGKPRPDGLVSIVIVGIGSPGSDTAVGQNFTATGTYNNANSVYGWMERQATNTYPTVTSFSNGNWTMGFANVPVGSGYTLNVRDDNNGSDTKLRISVLDPN